MGLLQTFNFDIIIIIMFVAGIAFGLYYGLFRQARKTLAIVLPFIGLYFTLEPVSKLVGSIGFFQTGIAFFVRYVSYLFPIGDYYHTVSILIVAILLFLVYYTVVFILVQMIGPSPTKIFFQKKDKWSNALGALLSLFASYVWIVMIVYMLSPFMVITKNNKISNFMIDSSIEIFEISKLYDYQYNNTRDYQRFLEFEDRVSLQGVVYFIWDLDQLEDTMDFIEQSLADSVPSLSADSITLLNGEFTIAKLIQPDDEGYIYDTINLNEQENAQMDVVRSYRDYMIDHIGYIQIIETYIKASTTIEEGIQNIIANQDIITDWFEGSNYQTIMETQLSDLVFYQTNQVSLYALLDNATVVTIQDYYEAFMVILADETLFETYRSEFKTNYAESTDTTLQAGVDLYHKIDKHWSNISLLPDSMSWTSRALLGSRYEEWFVLSLWENKAMLRSYLQDALTHSAIDSHRLYVEYVFAHYLLPDVDKNSTIVAEDISSLLSQLNDMVSTQLLSEEAAIQIVDQLFIGNDRIMKLFEMNDLLDNSAISALQGSTSPFVSDDVKQAFE